MTGSQNSPENILNENPDQEERIGDESLNAHQKDTSECERNVLSEAHHWVKAGAEAYPGVLFQAIVGDQLITAETPPSTRELWCDEIPPVWEAPTTSRQNKLDPGRGNPLLSEGSGGANSMVAFVFRNVPGLIYRQGNFVAA